MILNRCNSVGNPKKKQKSKQPWLKEHFDDAYVKKAQKEGYRSRAVYKLLEIQERDHLFRSGMTVVDLGSAPGGWSQLTVKYVGEEGRILALDILPMEPIDRVEFIQGDFQEQEVLNKMITLMNGRKVDLVISDMAPNISGMNVIDQPKVMYLSELAVDFARQILVPGGDILIKVFQGAGFDDLIQELHRSFGKVTTRKPKASRPRSREVYVVARDYHSHENHIVT